MTRQSFTYWLGTAMIIFAVSCLTWIYFPFLKLYFFPPPIKKSDSEPWITIPKIHASSPIILDVDPFDRVIYEKALKKGVAHAKGTAFLGQKGTIFLFAHSSGNPWEITRMNTVFLRLNELKAGDLIVISANGEEYSYRVKKTRIVSPADVSFLVDSQKGNALILQTCWPLGTDWRRLLVFASL
jgi:sortase A